MAVAATDMPAAVALRRAAHQHRRRAAGKLSLPLPPLQRCHSASHRGAAADDPALPPRCQAGHRHRTAIALLPLMTPCCRRASHRAAAADDAVLPPRCQASRRRRVIATAALLPPPCCHVARHRRPAAALPLLVIIITNSTNTRVLAELVIMITNKGVSLGSGPSLCKPCYSDACPLSVAWLLT